MKILVAGDIHGNLGHAQWVVDRAVAEEADHILQVGDFGFWTHQAWSVEFLDELSDSLAEAGLTITVVRGNHDNYAKILRDHGHDRDEYGFVRVRENIRTAPDGLVWEWGGKKFISLGGAYSLDKDDRLYREKVEKTPGARWFPEEEMTDEDMDRYIKGGPDLRIDVIVAHDRPSCAENLRPPLRDPRLLPNPARLTKAIETLTPGLFLHGHMHLRYDARVPSGDGYTDIVGLSSDPKTSDTKDPEDSVWVLDTASL